MDSKDLKKELEKNARRMWLKWRGNRYVWSFRRIAKRTKKADSV